MSFAEIASTASSKPPIKKETASAVFFAFGENNPCIYISIVVIYTLNKQLKRCNLNDRQPNWKVVVNELLKTRTQADLAEMVGVAQQQISNLKNGNRGKNISYTLGYDLLSLYKIAKIKS